MFCLGSPRSLMLPNEDSDSSESSWHAKWRQPASNSDLTSKHDLQWSHQRLTVPLQIQLERASSISHSGRRQSKMDPNSTSVGVEESMLIAGAEYQEWPMSGVFAWVIIGDEVRSECSSAPLAWCQEPSLSRWLLPIEFVTIIQTPQLITSN